MAFFLTRSFGCASKMYFVSFPPTGTDNDYYFLRILLITTATTTTTTTYYYYGCCYLYYTLFGTSMNGLRRHGRDIAILLRRLCTQD